MQRILLVLAVIVVGSLGVVTAASGGQLGSSPLGEAPATSIPTPSPTLAPPAAVSYTPVADAAGVDPRVPATVTVEHGTLARVTLTDEKGKTVDGSIDAAGTAWASTAPLRYGTTYTWGGTATGTDGASGPLLGSFRTLAPTKKVRATINIGDGRTVGVAAPIRIQFNGHIDDRAAVERNLSVTTSTPAVGSWGWLPDEGGGSRVDYRPKEYWPANTDVTVAANLAGVDYGGGDVGAVDVKSTFRIGRSQIVKADVNSFRMVVVRDGQPVADYPASYGLGADPDRNTRSGVHVVTERFTDKRMVSERYGYDVQEKWAVRISNNGEFIHANPASASAQGASNVTHGCVNLSIADAQAYYDTAIYGDPVEVTGTPVPLSPKDGDIWDWTMSWEKWQELSAL